MDNKEKLTLLEQSKFIYVYAIKSYVNFALKKIFSIEAIEKNTPNWINSQIKTKNKRWKLYFIQTPSFKVRNKILQTIHNQTLDLT